MMARGGVEVRSFYPDLRLNCLYRWDADLFIVCAIKRRFYDSLVRRIEPPICIFEIFINVLECLRETLCTRVGFFPWYF